MSNRFQLLSMKNDELVAGLSQLVQRSNELTGDLLAHLAELEERMIHLKLGFSSSFAYCVEALGLSEGAAGRRIAAARVCRRFPEAFDLVARGDLHLSALCGLAAHLNPENATELFGACRRKTRRQVEELLAARFPKPDVRDQIRRLPGRAQVPERGQTQAQAATQPSATTPLQDAAAEKSVETVEDRDVETARPAEAGAATPPRHREMEALSVDRFGVHFTADAELRTRFVIPEGVELIERARALASHRLPKNEPFELDAARAYELREKRRGTALRGRNKAAQGKGCASAWRSRGSGKFTRRKTNARRCQVLEGQQAQSPRSRRGETRGVPSGSRAMLVCIRGRAAMPRNGVPRARPH